MARLPRRSPIGFRPEFRDRDAMPVDSASTRPVEAFGTSDGRSPRSGAPQVEAPPDGIDFEAAIDGVLAAGGVDPVTRVRLREARRALADGLGTEGAEDLVGTSLSRALFKAVLPRLHHPEALRTDRHRALLERLAQGLDGAAVDGVVRDGALAVHRELRRLARLRTGRNALVEG